MCKLSYKAVNIQSISVQTYLLFVLCTIFLSLPLSASHKKDPVPNKTLRPFSKELISEQALENNPPTSAPKEINIYEDGIYYFSASDFYFEDIDDGDVLQKVMIFPPSSGFYEFDGNRVFQAMEIEISNIEKLVYYPNSVYRSLPHAYAGFHVSDGKNYSEYYIFEINLVTGNNGYAQVIIPNKDYKINSTFSFTIPRDLFFSFDNPDDLYITAQLSGTYGMLPHWMSFDGQTFSGQPNETGTFYIEVLAHENFGDFPFDSRTFKITVHDENVVFSCDATLNKNELDFGYQVVGGASFYSYVNIMVSEIGLCDYLNISSIDISNPSFVLGHNPSSSIKAGEESAIGIIFKPLQAGDQSAILTIHHDGVGSPFTITLKGHGIAVAENHCDPISILPCEEIPVTLPFSLDFSGDEGGISYTGFTMVDAYSSTHPQGHVAFPSVRGLDLSKLSFKDGKLTYTSNGGTFYSKNNNQKNALGVQINARQKLVIETSIQKNTKGSGDLSAGIWFGLNDKTYVKLSFIGGNKVELLKEFNDISSTIIGLENPDQRIVSIAPMDQIYLRLEVDPFLNTVEGFYSLDGTNFSNVGEAYVTKTLDISETGLIINEVYSGIYTSGGFFTSFSFDNFSITEVVEEPFQYDLGVTKSGQGTVTPEAGNYSNGSAVTITATPDPGYIFKGWSGDATGNDNPLNLIMDSHKEIVANFTQETYEVTASASIGGTVDLSPQKDFYLYDEIVTITATPLNGYEFSGWDGSESNSNVIHLKINSNTTVHANFNLVQYTLKVSSSPGGNVQKSPDLLTYNYGAEVTLTATPLTGHIFTGWSGANSGLTNPLKINIDDHMEIIAQFSPVIASEAIRINSGGKTQNVNGISWTGCFRDGNCNGYISGGYAHSFKKLPNVTGIESNMNQAIFQTEWTGGASRKGTVAPGSVAFTYNVPVENGTYLVRLHFAEVNKNGENQRLFDVNIESGARELVNFDIFKESGGMYKAIVKEFTTSVTDGNVTVEFYRNIDNAKINAIEIIPVSSESQMQVVNDAKNQSVLSSTNNVDIANNENFISLEIYPNPAIGKYVTVGFSIIEKQQDLQLLIFDNMGIQVMRKDIKRDVSGSGKIEIYLDDKFKRGIYMIMLSTPGSKTTKKLIVD